MNLILGKSLRDGLKCCLIEQKTCIKTITLSGRQEYPMAPLIYILHIEPMACGLRRNNDTAV